MVPGHGFVLRGLVFMACATAFATGTAFGQVEMGDEVILKNVWPQFRGPNSTGQAPAQDIPVTWNGETGENILWKADLPLQGPNSPVVWADKVFLTAADADTRKVLCFNAKTGEKLWEKEYSDTEANNELMVDGDYMYAAPTAVCTQRYVVAHFANGDVVCFDHDGNEQWAKNLADTSGNMYGQASSLVLFADNVIAQVDDGVEVTLYSMKVKDGTLDWHASLEDSVSWASPAIAQVGTAKWQVLVAGSPYVAGFDARKGTLLWQADIMGGDMAPSPLFVDGKAVFLFSGYGMYAIKTDGEGEVQDTHVAWQLDDLDESGLPDTCSPATDGKYIYVFNAGFLAAVQASDGKVVYEHDTGAYGTYASPVVVGDKILLGAGEETLVCKTGPEFKLLGKGKLNASYDCTPAISEGRIYIRTASTLYCIAGKGPVKEALNDVEDAVDNMRRGVKDAADATEEAVDGVRRRLQDALE